MQSPRTPPRNTPPASPSTPSTPLDDNDTLGLTVDEGRARVLELVQQDYKNLYGEYSYWTRVTPMDLRHKYAPNSTSGNAPLHVLMIDVIKLRATCDALNAGAMRALVPNVPMGRRTLAVLGKSQQTSTGTPSRDARLLLFDQQYLSPDELFERVLHTVQIDLGAMLATWRDCIIVMAIRVSKGELSQSTLVFVYEHLSRVKIILRKMRP